MTNDDATLTAADALGEMLADPRPLSVILPGVLSQLLAWVGGAGCGLLLTAWDARDPEWYAAGRVPTDWEAAPVEGGPAWRTLKPDMGAVTAVGPDASAELTLAVPLTAWRQSLGVLLLVGASITPSQRHMFFHLGRVLARAILTRRAAVAAEAACQPTTLQRLAEALASTACLDRVQISAAGNVYDLHDVEAVSWRLPMAYPARAEAQRAPRVIVLAPDAATRRRLEAALAHSERLAAAGQLAAGVAHEISNPLAAIVANVQLLQREFSQGDERRQSVDLMAVAGQRAVRAVRGLLDLARGDQAEQGPIDVAESLRGVIRLVEPQLRTGAIRLSADLPTDLPRLWGNSDQLSGVWINLVLNACHALGDGPGEIRVTAAQRGQEIHITFADTGEGIPGLCLPRVFEPFYTTKPAGQGTGLGLAMVDQVIKHHGGQVQVFSSLGQGTVFAITLPCQPPEEFSDSRGAPDR